MKYGWCRIESKNFRNPSHSLSENTECIFLLHLQLSTLSRINWRNSLPFYECTETSMFIHFNCQKSDIILPKGSNPRQFFWAPREKETQKKNSISGWMKRYVLCIYWVSTVTVNHTHLCVLILLSWWDF